jgi:hypothetical protein
MYKILFLYESVIVLDQIHMKILGMIAHLISIFLPYMPSRWEIFVVVGVYCI